MAATISCRSICAILLLASPLLGQTADREMVSSLSKKSTRVMAAATDLGAGGFGFYRLGRPSQTNFIFGAGLFSARNLVDRTINGAVYTQRGALLPFRFGIRNEIFREELPSLDWAFYWVSTVGPVLALGYPAGLDFQRTFSHINLGLGGEVYNALGLEAAFGVGFVLYLEGGVYAMNTFASRSLFPKSNYIGPSLAFGIRTGF